MIRLRLLLLHACALVISAGVAAGLSQLFAGGTDLYVPAFVVALAHAIVLGIPSYLVVRTRGDYAWWIAPLCGFLIGALPFGLLSLIPAAQEASVGKVATVVGGSYTLAGWIEYLSGVAAGGLLGAAGGLAFGLTVRPTLSRAADKPNWRLLDTVPVTLAAVAVGMVIWVPYATSDRSCHNPLRDGGNSIASELEAELPIEVSEWPDFVRIMREFARAERWSYRDYVRTGEDFNWLDVSICDEAGTEIHATDMGSGSDRRVYLSVMQPQGGLSWRQPYKVLYRKLAARWPGRMEFRDQQGRDSSLPAWLSGP